MLPGTWSVLIDGRGSAVPGQAAGRRHLGSIRLRLCSFLRQLKAPQRWAEDWAGGSAALQPPPVPCAFPSEVLEASPCRKLTFLSGIQMSAPPLGLSALDCLFQSLT